ncbi:MAG: LEA type 2 family protein [Thermodesulfobacteriota bacterium]
MTKTTPKLALLCALLLFAACESISPFFASPEVRFEDMEQAKGSMLESTLHFSFRIHNPNPLAAKLVRVFYTLTVADQSVARGRIKLNHRIPPAGTRTVVVPVALHFRDFIAAAPGFIHRDTIPYRITGSFEIMGFNRPFATSGEIQNSRHRLFRGPSQLYCDH